MNYEKAYKEALNKAKSKIENDKGHVLYEDDIVEIFPELAESEDEKIRKAIKSILAFSPAALFDKVSVSREDAITWFEKQNHDGKKWIYEDVYIKEKEEIYQDGVDDVLENPQKYGLEKQGELQYWKPSEEQLEALDYAYNSCPDTARGNYYESVLRTLIDELYKLQENQGEQNPTDKVDPKFKVGDWVVDNRCGGVRQVVFLEDDGYEFPSGGWVSYEDANKHFHLWTINDAKEGDVLVASDGSLFIFAKVKNNSAYYHISLCKNGCIQISNGTRAWEVADACHPTTEEQRDFLFQKMEEAGYTWNVEKKELIKNM